MAQIKEKISIGELKLNQQAEDLANNNIITEINQQIENLSINSEYLFNSEIFSKIKPENFVEKYKKFELVHNESTKQFHIDLGDNLIIRPLKRDDYKRNYLELLSQLTVVGDIPQEQFEKRFDEMCQCQGTFYTFVIVDVAKDHIAGTITHVYERKFFRNTGARGRIEDVVVDQSYRGKKLSKILLDVATQMSCELGCYKLSLECVDDLKKLYMQFGFKLEDKQNYLCRRN